MAWRQPAQLTKLIARYNNVDQEIAPYQQAELLDDEKINLLADPYHLSSWPKSANSDQGAAYTEMHAMLIGGIDLCAWNSLMSNNTTLTVYNSKVGLTFALVITKNSDYNFKVQIKSYDQYVTLYDHMQCQGGSGGTWGPHCSFGFLVNDDTRAGSFYLVRTYNSRYNSSIQTCYRYLWASPISGDTNKSILSSCVYSLVSGNEPTPGPSGGNPYAGGGLNDEPAGGEDQNFEETSDTILEPTLPSNPATGSGFITAYVPTLSQINDVADYLIDPSVLQALAGTVLKLSDVIIGLNIFPFSIPATGSKEIKLNLCGVHLTSGVTCNYSDSQYATIDMGTLDIKKYWDNCLDYDPYTKISMYLPYIGYIDLDADEVMDKTIGVKYNVDILTGCCVALIIVDGSVMYQYPGECGSQIPISSVSFDNFLSNTVDLALSTVGAAKAIKGAAAGVAAAEKNFTQGMTASEVANAYEGLDKAKDNYKAVAQSEKGNFLLNAAVSAVDSAKGRYSHAGALTSCAGFLGTQKPFIIIKRPRQCMPEGYESISGFPCNMKATLGDLSGYTEIGDIHLNIPNATVQEIVECENLLKGGVFL